MKYLGFVLGVLLMSGDASSQNSRFFANPDIQAEAPLAFALQAGGLPILQDIEARTLAERELLVEKIFAEPRLAVGIANWAQLSMGEQIPILREIFAIQVAVMGIRAPELVIEEGTIPGPAFFEFDPQNPGPGRVILNPTELLKEESPYAALSLLLHETRHSAQFQMAFPREGGSPAGAMALAYQAAFLAQKQLAGRLSFCDFLTLWNEFEAFSYGNYVLGRLTNWRIDLIGMGTFASQFDSQGNLKINLINLFIESGPRAVLNKFNDLEQVQFQLLQGS